MLKPSQTFPKHFKPATVDRIHALQKGMRRKYPKISHASCKTHKARSTHLPNDAECYVARRYRRDLSHFV